MRDPAEIAGQPHGVERQPYGLPALYSHLMLRGRA